MCAGALLCVASHARAHHVSARELCIRALVLLCCVSCACVSLFVHARAMCARVLLCVDVMRTVIKSPRASFVFVPLCFCAECLARVCSLFVCARAMCTHALLCTASHACAHQILCAHCMRALVLWCCISCACAFVTLCVRVLCVRTRSCVLHLMCALIKLLRTSSWHAFWLCKFGQQKGVGGVLDGVLGVLSITFDRKFRSNGLSSRRENQARRKISQKRRSFL
jgi:hypothetical protein